MWTDRFDLFWSTNDIVEAGVAEGETFREPEDVNNVYWLPAESEDEENPINMWKVYQPVSATSYKEQPRFEAGDKITAYYNGDYAGRNSTWVDVGSPVTVKGAVQILSFVSSVVAMLSFLH